MDERNNNDTSLEGRFFLLLTAIITIAFAVVIEPFFAAIVWSLVAAIMFTPLNQWLLKRMPGRRNLAALISLACIVVVVIIPTIFLFSILIEEASSFYEKVQNGQIDFRAYVQQVQNILPGWATRLLDRFGLTDMAAIEEKVTTAFVNSLQWLATRALLIGQGALTLFIMLGVALYLTYFLLRDGEDLARKVEAAVPLRRAQYRTLTTKFAQVTRATIKGSFVVAIVQGALGGIAFAFLDIPGAVLWAVVMGVLSLLPAVGTGLVWIPVAIYLFAIGAVWKGIALTLFGTLVIGMVDNVLRPILVGRSTRIPDWLVLITTLGGIEIFGFSGFIVGPMVAGLFLSVWEMMTEGRRQLAMSQPGT